MSETTIVDMVRRSGISSDVLDRIYSTYSDSPNLAVEQICKFLDSKQYTNKTICKTVLPKIKKYLTSIGDYRKKGWGLEVVDILYSKYNPTIKAINTEYDRLVNPEKKARVSDLNTDAIVNWAIETLKNDDRWHRVSLALAVVSGRRMVELHGENRHFEVGNGIITPIVNDRALDKTYQFPQTLVFTGQAKTKSKDDLSFQIPVLCEPQLFLERWNNLPPERLNLDPTIVNKRVSTLISNATKKLRASLGIKAYKDSRDIYSNMVMVYFDSTNDLSDKEREILKGHLLGHEMRIATSERYGK